MQYYIKDNYYFDIDNHNQVRITGPENHLLFGATFPPNVELIVKSYDLKGTKLVIDFEAVASRIELKIPLVTDIRTLRGYTEGQQLRPSYEELSSLQISELLPTTIKKTHRKESTAVVLTTTFVDENGKENTYGAKVRVVAPTTIHVDGSSLVMAGDSALSFRISTVTNIKVKGKIRKKLFTLTPPLPTELLSPELLALYDISGRHIEHLVKSKKTSSFEYGTLFPRDWIESADLGEGDLSANTIDYMYLESMRNISPSGEGWHEDIVGNYKTRVTDSSMHIDRKMIDIEPRYILGLRRVSRQLLVDPEFKDKICIVAQYLISNAKNLETIAFKKKASLQEEYEFVGNWRDSYLAYPHQKSPLVPYDVNCVFYPSALKVIRNYHEYFGITDLDALNALITKWSDQKDKFILSEQSNLVGYSLALHGEGNASLPIAHLDESYDLFYGTPSMEEIASFSRRVIDPAFFYTPVGPILVGANEDDFSTQQYHGKVIWPKQAAFVVAGLARQYVRGLRESWSWPVMELMKNAVIQTSRACFTGWMDLGGVVPELYYYDASTGKARFYTDQEKYEGQMSLIQLWSSVGCRRIMRDYVMVMKAASIL